MFKIHKLKSSGIQLFGNERAIDGMAKRKKSGRLWYVGLGS